MAHIASADAHCSTGPGLGQPPSPRVPSRGALEVAADLNRRFAQLAWPTVAEVDAGGDGREAIDVRRRSTSGEDEGPATHFQLGAGAPGADVERILLRLKELGWDRGTATAPGPGVPKRARWCVPE